jgi:uncharacterized protein (TIGR00730 family)
VHSGAKICFTFIKNGGKVSKTITVFGSGIVAENSSDWETAYETGVLLAKAGFTVANGGYDGAMLASAQGAKSAGGKTIGVTTDEFQGARKNEFIDQEIRKPLWRERLFQLIDLADGFVVLDGGTGTLVELMVIWEMGNKSFHEKPAVVLGNHMKKAIQALKQNPEVRIPKNFYFAETLKAAAEYLKKALLCG